MRKHALPNDMAYEGQRRDPAGLVQGLARAALVPWIALWSWVAWDSVLAYHKSRKAIDEAIEADPIAELYEGPQPQSGRIKRWLLWTPGSLDRLRVLRKRARAAMIGAPLIAVAGSTVLIGLAAARRKRG
jgi:hypothetical protein